MTCSTVADVQEKRKKPDPLKPPNGQMAPIMEESGSGAGHGAADEEQHGDATLARTGRCCYNYCKHSCTLNCNALFSDGTKMVKIHICRLSNANANRGIYFVSQNVLSVVTICYYLKSVKSVFILVQCNTCLLYTSPSPRD